MSEQPDICQAAANSVERLNFCCCQSVRQLHGVAIALLWRALERAAHYQNNGNSALIVCLDLSHTCCSLPHPAGIGDGGGHDVSIM